jgi:hypothetical protein
VVLTGNRFLMTDGSLCLSGVERHPVLNDRRQPLFVIQKVGLRGVERHPVLNDRRQPLFVIQKVGLMRVLIFVFIILGSFGPASAGRKHKPEGEVTRFAKRGPGAWDNHGDGRISPLHEGGSTRLLIHAVADASLAQWLPKVKEFLMWVLSQGIPFETEKDVDPAIAQYFDFLCYAQQRHPSLGSTVMFGYLCLAPQLKGRMPLSARSLKSWTKLTISSEGGPLAEEAIWLIAVCMISHGWVEAGLWTIIQYDIYGREQDLEQLCAEDVASDGQRVSLDLGVAARGETTKTGAGFGVVIRRGWIATLVLALKILRCKGKLLKIKQQAFRMAWTNTCRRLGLAYAGPPHNIRHSGPSEDLQNNVASLETVRRRGRWKVLESVQRYTKTFALTKFRSRMPPATRTRALEVSADVISAVRHALSAGKNAADSTALHILAALEGHLMTDQTPDTVILKEKGTRKQKKTAAEEEFEDVWATD